jgi:hypothetical protein
MHRNLAIAIFYESGNLLAMSLMPSDKIVKGQFSLQYHFIGLIGSSFSISFGGV